MKLDYIKEKKELISVCLLCISVLFSILITIRIISYFKLSAKAQNMENMFKTIIAKDNNKSDDMDKYLKPAKEMVNSLKKVNLFAPPQERKNPITQIPCILGNEVCINDKWYKEGDMVQDAKIIAIEPTQVTVEWDGKTTIFRPLDAPMASSGPGERPPAGPGTPPSVSPSMGRNAPPAQPPGEEIMPNDGPGMVPNVPLPKGLPPELAEKMKSEMQNIMPMIQNMSPEEIEKARQELGAQFFKGAQSENASSK